MREWVSEWVSEWVRFEGAWCCFEMQKLLILTSIFNKQRAVPSDITKNTQNCQTCGTACTQVSLIAGGGKIPAEKNPVTGYLWISYRKCLPWRGGEKPLMDDPLDQQGYCVCQYEYAKSILEEKKPSLCMFACLPFICKFCFSSTLLTCSLFFSPFLSPFSYENSKLKMIRFWALIFWFSEFLMRFLFTCRRDLFQCPLGWDEKSGITPAIFLSVTRLYTLAHEISRNRAYLRTRARNRLRHQFVNAFATAVRWRQQRPEGWMTQNDAKKVEERQRKEQMLNMTKYDLTKSGSWGFTAVETGRG